NVEQMEAVARGMEARGVSPDLFTYNALIGGYARAGRWRAAIGVYERVREDEMVEPDRVTCVEMAMMLAAAKQPIPLRAVLDDMLALRIPVDAKLLERAVPVLARGGEHAVITALHRSLCQEGVKLPASLAVACINAYGALGMPQHAEGVFQALQQQQGRVEDRRVYVGLLRAYASNGQMREAEGVVQDMLQGGVRPSTGCFLALLDGWSVIAASNGQMHEAEGVVQDMLQGGVRPSTGCFLALLDGWVVGGKLGRLGTWGGKEGPEGVVQDMLQGGVRPSTGCFLALLDGEHEMRKAAERVVWWCSAVQDTLQGGVRPSAGCFLVLLDGWVGEKGRGEMGEYEEHRFDVACRLAACRAEGVLEQLLRRLIRRRAACSLKGIELYCVEQQLYWDGRRAAARRLQLLSSYPDRSYTRLGEFGLAEGERSTIHARATDSSHPTLPSLLPSPPRSYTRLGEFGLAEGVLEYMRELQLTPDPSLHLALISAYLSASHPAWAHSALCDLLAEHPAFQPPVEVVEGIMAGYLGGEGEGGVAEGGEAEGKGEGVGLDGSNAAPAAAAGSADSAAAGAADPPAAGSAAAAAAAEAVLQVAVKRGVEPSNACRQLLLRARLVQAEEGERGTGKEREEGGEGGEGGVEKGEGKEGAVSVVEAAENAAGGKVAEESIKTVENGKAAAPETQVESAAVAGAEESTVAGAKSTVAAEESAVAVAGAAVVEVEKELDAPVITGTGEATATASHATAAEVTGKAAAVKVAETAAAVKVAETAAAVKVTETAAAVKVTEKAAAVKVSEKAAAVKVTEKAAAVKVTEKAAVKVTEKAAAVKVTEKAVAVKVTEKAADVKVTEKATAPEKMAKPAELTEKATAAEVGGVLSSTEATEQTREESLLLMLQKGFTVGEKQVVAELEAAGLVGGEESEKGAVGGVAVGGGGPAAVMTLWKTFIMHRWCSLSWHYPLPSYCYQFACMLFASSYHIISSFPPPVSLSPSAALQFPLLPLHPFPLRHVQSLRSIPNFQPTVAMFVPVIKNRALAGDFPSLCSIMADLRGLGLIPSDQVFAALRLAPLESAGAKTSAAVTSTAVAEASKEVVLEGGSGKGEGGDGGGVKQRVSGKGKYRRKASEKKDERDEEKDVRGEKSEGKPVVVKREVEAGGEVEAVEQKGRGEVLEPMKVVAEEGNKQAEIEMVVSVGKFSVEREDETGIEKKRLDTSIDQKDRKRTEKTVQAQRLDVGAVENASGSGGETMQKQEEMMGNVVEKAGREKNGRKRDLEKVGLGKGALANVKGFGPWSKATKKAGKGFGKTGGKGVRKEQKLKEDMNVEIAREAAHVETVVETVA
ncbi:unnamed protein product, partial [Closterium sp. Naga37s-1]